jgi:hypothetical protein
MNTDIETLLGRCYAAFNDRDDASRPHMAECVGGRLVKGRDGVRKYWQRQWTAIDPRVEPRAFRLDAEGRVVVSVHQVVRDLPGKVLADQIVDHVYEMQDGLVRRMEIR